MSKDVQKGNLVPRTITNVVGRKVLVEMIILDELLFRFVRIKDLEGFVFLPT